MSAYRKIINSDIVIVGGGAAGLWLAYELAKSNFRCSIIDTQPFAAYASTRNQGWLHSGALYAAYDAKGLAAQCQQGYNVIMQFCKEFAPEAIRSHIPCYYPVSTEEQQNSVLNKCYGLGIPAEPVPFDYVAQQAPILSKQEELQPKYMIRGADVPINTHLLLTVVKDFARQSGVYFHSLASWDNLSYTNSNGSWRVDDGETYFESNFLVLACGPIIPDMIRRFLPHHKHIAEDIQITKTKVLAIHYPISTAMLINLFAVAPHIIPFCEQGSDTIQGITVCIAYDNSKANGSLSSLCDLNDLYTGFHSVNSFYPKLSNIVMQDGPILAQGYYCYKMSLRDSARPLGSPRNNIIMSLSEENAIIFYAGKFTTAAIGAHECAEAIKSQCGVPKVTQETGMELSNNVAIDIQPYYNHKANTIHYHDGKIVISGDQS